MKILLLDAMGVIFRARDDVAELLVPFARAHGSPASDAQIEASYVETSLGRATAAAFWRSIGVAPDLEDSYLELHRTDPALPDVLAWAATAFQGVSCLSNDVSEWSAKLRRRHRLEDRIGPWFISGDLGHRKPAPEIYAAVLERSGLAPADVLFVDDRLKNVDAAAAIGFHTVWLDHDRSGDGGRHATIAALDLLPQVVATLREGVGPDRRGRRA